jgi:NADH:ubiquinone oxidoreductase subunit C
MYGIKFLFHIGLRRILTDYGFKGYPLRKDFPLSGYVDIYYDDSIQSIKVVPLELTQSLRFFKFENP